MGNMGLTAIILPQMAENHHFLAVYRGGKMNTLRHTGSEAIHEYLNPSRITTQQGNPDFYRPLYRLQGEA